MSGNFIMRHSKLLCTPASKCKWFDKHMVFVMDSFCLLLKSQE